MSSSKEISILYSGGSDSSLAAALMCGQFDKIHLLTYYHTGIPLADRAKINATKLTEKFGADKIVHKLINFETILKKLYYGTYINDLIRYRSYMTPCSCIACQLAMHTSTIMYNIDNNITSTCDGYKREKSHLYIFMHEDGVTELTRFYKHFKMDYSNPVYNIIRTDWMLYDMGITSKKNVKFPQEILDYSTQHHCRNGIIVNAYLMGYFIPVHGQESSAKQSLMYLNEKIELCEKYICEKLIDNSW